MNSYQFRQMVRAAWNEPFNPNYAMILKISDRFETIAALRTFATELGARAIILDIEGDLTPDQIKMLDRKGPRIVIIVGIETLPAPTAGKLSAMINSGGRAMPVILWIEAEEALAADDDETTGSEALAA